MITNLWKHTRIHQVIQPKTSYRRWCHFLDKIQSTSNWLEMHYPKHAICIWVFPQIMVPPNHPILIGFGTIINHPFWGTPIFGNTHILNFPFIFFVRGLLLVKLGDILRMFATSILRRLAEDDLLQMASVSWSDFSGLKTWEWLDNQIFKQETWQKKCRNAGSSIAIVVARG